jgi:hypothetical protein
MNVTVNTEYNDDESKLISNHIISNSIVTIKISQLKFV